jgi:HrpA-like RNA helicase
MCTEPYFYKLPEQREPEIMRVPLTGVIVELLNVGLDPEELFSNRIPEEKMKDTITTLQTLKMLDAKKNVTEIGNFAAILPLAVRNSAIIYNWMKTVRKDDGTSYPVYPIVVLAALIDCFGPYYFYPRKEEGMNAKEYETVKMKTYAKYFAKFEGFNDIESMMRMWNVMMSELQTLKPGYLPVLEWSKKNSMNNKKMQEVVKIVRQCCTYIAKNFGQEIVLGPFNERKVYLLSESLIQYAYYNFIFTHSGSGNYYNAKTKEYFRLDRRQGVNITDKETPMKIVALRTAEISGAGKKSSNVISLFIPAL